MAGPRFDLRVALEIVGHRLQALFLLVEDQSLQASPTSNISATCCTSNMPEYARNLPACSAATQRALRIDLQIAVLLSFVQLGGCRLGVVVADSVVQL